jgi:hypothetical protein
MKRTLLAVALLAVTGAASAAPSLSWAELSEASPNSAFDPNSGLPYNGTSFASSTPVLGSPYGKISLGVLSATGVGSSGAKVTYTYLGKEAGFQNIFFAPVSTQVWQINTPLFNNSIPAVGSTSTNAVASNGALDFKFVGDASNSAVNGGAWSTYASIGLIAENYSGSLGTYSFIIGYNDSFSTHNDWDDMVIGVNIAPVPEPETYAMLLAGLGLMGFVARRRKQSAKV